MGRLKCTNKEIERSVSNSLCFANEISFYYSRFNYVDDRAYDVADYAAEHP